MANNIKYMSGDFTVATAVGALRNESPLLPELNDVLIFHQDYVQFFNDFVALPYNTLNPDLVDEAYLFDESPREDIGGGVCKWTRSWVRIPDTYGKAGGTYPFTFPGFETADTSSTSVPKKKPVAMEITREFFLCGTYGAYSSWQDIPIIPATKFYEIQTGSTDTSVASGDVNGPMVRDPGTDGPDDLGTSPSLTEYKAMIAAKSTIQVEDSKISNFRGGVYMRETFTVVAQ